MKSLLDSNKHLRGGALIVAVMTLTILASTAAVVMFHIASKYRNISQATSWRKAMVSAESGVDFAMQALMDSANGEAGAWTGWTGSDPVAGTTYTSTALVHTGEGGTSLYYKVTVDSPAALNGSTSSRTKRYYRIRSTGYADLAGGKRVTNESLDVGLRKLSLTKDRKTGVALATPRASRIIEAVVMPETEVKARNTAHVKWEFSGYKNATRAFDSSDTTYSTGGKYDPAKTLPSDLSGILLDVNQWHKDYEKKGTLEKVDLKNAEIYGDFAALAGPVKNGTGVKGETVFDHTTELPKVLAPTWTLTDLTDSTLTKWEGGATAAQKTAWTTWKSTASAAMVSAVGNSNEGLVLRGSSTQSNPTKYKMTKVKSEDKKDALVLANPAGVSESWIEIWTTEEFKVKGKGVLAVADGVHVTIHFTKKLKFKDGHKNTGGSFVESGFAGDLQLRGVEVAESDKETDDDFSPVKTSGKVKIKDTMFTGVVYAPDYDMELKSRDTSAPGDQQYILGAVTGRKIKFKGDTDFITDLALTQSGKTVLAYKIASWFEDSE